MADDKDKDKDIVATDDQAADGDQKDAEELNPDDYIITQVDPKANIDELAKTQKIEFAGNDTISANDNSTIGGYLSYQDRPNENYDDTLPEYRVVDPEKMDFIKTYTKEFDDLVDQTTHAVGLILDSIDKTVKEHLDDITIPEEANPFLVEKLEDGRVTKFDDAQQIVRLIMSKAIEAKSSSEQAAIEASRVYDNIQQFKKDTNDQITDIYSRDEFGRPKQEGQEELTDYNEEDEKNNLYTSSS